jgi:hypothetical protein
MSLDKGDSFGHQGLRRLPCALTKPSVLLAATLIPVCGGHADQFVRPMAPVVAMVHVHVIDGTGGPARDDQTVIIERGRIVALGDTAAIRVPPGASTLDLPGRTVIPGLVGRWAGPSRPSCCRIVEGKVMGAVLFSHVADAEEAIAATIVTFYTPGVIVSVNCGAQRAKAKGVRGGEAPRIVEGGCQHDAWE